MMNCSESSTPRQSQQPAFDVVRETFRANPFDFIFFHTEAVIADAAGPHEGGGRHEAAQLIAGVQGLVQWRTGAVGQVSAWT